MREIKYIIVHCSDSPDNLDIGVKEITEWHKARGWDTCGYHNVIRRSGEIEKGRPYETQGAHCLHFNFNSIGICLIGKKQFTGEQFWSLKMLCYELKLKYPNAEIKGHRDFETNKTCPNFNVQAIV